MAVLTYNGNIIGKSSANDGVLTITQNNVTKGTFSANQSNNNTIALTDTTYDNATQSTSGLMSATDFNKLNAKSLVANDDLDNFTTLGLYACPTGAIAATVLHSPYTSNEFSLYVLPSNTQDGKIQILYPHGTTDHASYIRSYYSGIWHDWKEFALKEDVVKLANSSAQTVAITTTGNTTVMNIKSGNDTESRILFSNASGTALGYIGANSSNKPIFSPGSGSYELAQVRNVITITNSGVQSIENTSTSQYATLMLKSNHPDGKAVVGFRRADNTTIGYLGVSANNKPIFLSGVSGSTDQEIALKNEFESTTIGGVTFYKNGNTVSFYGLASNLPTATSITFGQLPAGFRPKNTYTISPFYLDSAIPYSPIGTVWINNSNGTVVIYKGGQESGYLSGTYLAE